MAKRISTTATSSQIKPTDLVGFHNALAKWYKTHGRHDLPWRNTADPYPIRLSEVMLQQTQVTTVRERFYFPFLKKFPTIEALAAAPRETVMKAWEGLGYYRRAGFLHEAAKRLVTEGGFAPCATKADGHHRTPHAKGQTPPSLEQLVALPGIGRNTASAILAFAYHQPVAILEANVKRVVARIFALEQPTDSELWAGAKALLNKTTPFDYNQAMMDLGSMVCTPKSPRCNPCPASAICQGKSSPERYPTRQAKKQTPTRDVIIHVREDARGRLFLEKRDEALLGGLYGFPQTPFTSSTKQCEREEAFPSTIGHVTHVYSHFKLMGTVVHEPITATPNSPNWYTREHIATLPLSKLDHKVLSLVENCHSTKKKHTKALMLRRTR